MLDREFIQDLGVGGGIHRHEEVIHARVLCRGANPESSTQRSMRICPHRLLWIYWSVHSFEHTGMEHTSTTRSLVPLAIDAVFRTTNNDDHESPSSVLAFFDVDLTMGTV